MAGRKAKEKKVEIKGKGTKNGRFKMTFADDHQLLGISSLGHYP